MRFTSGLVGLVLSMAWALGLAGSAAAQAQIPVYQLEPIERADIPQGKAAFVAGEVGATPDRFFLGNLYMLKPVSVTVRAVNPGDELQVKLTKFRWEDVLREGRTGSQQSQVQFQFRTHDEFQISITASKPGTPYKMVVWVGPDVQVDEPDVVVPRSQYREPASSRLVWWVTGGAVGAALCIALVWFVRRRRA